MKTIGHILLVVLLGLGVMTQAAETEKSPAILLQEAIYQEETAGDLDKAIELYGQVLEQAADVERLAARATYQLGLCHLKKGDNEFAAQYFQKAISNYPKQTSVVKKAQTQLDKIVSTVSEGILFEKLPQEVLMAIGNMYGQTCSKAGLKSLYTNSNIHYVNSDFVSSYGGYGYYTNQLNIPLAQKVRLSGTSYPNQSHYDIAGRKMNTEIVPDEKRENFYHIYWTPAEALPPGQFYMYGWCLHEAKTLPMMPGFANKSKGERRALTMQNHFGSHAFEVFYLVVPDSLQIAETAEQYTDKQTVGDYVIYAWEKEVQPDENHVVTVYLSKKPANQKQTYTISDNMALDLDSGASIQIESKEIPIEYDIGWDNDGGGALMVNPKGSSTIVGLAGVKKGDWDEAIKSAKNSIALLKQKGSRGFLANTATFCAVLTDQGNLYVIEITDYSPERVTLNVLKLIDEANQPIDLSTPEATIKSFVKAVYNGNLEVAKKCISKDGHDYDEFMEMLATESNHPFQAMIKAMDASIPVEITSKSIEDGKCKISWYFTLDRVYYFGDTKIEKGAHQKFGSYLELVGDKWLIRDI
ncbi:MAG: tetratricopeptide repeat protein [Phycisphaerae bacterium]|nr:tetratricopeptide repeat protein [Phycisphaerae bacterium]